MLYLQMERLFVLCLCGVASPSRGNCSPSEWILVRLVGCIPLDISQEWQPEFAAVDAMFALRLISVLIYLYAA